jgi:tetratricopeptide (TPR) repeat protein
MLLHAYDQLASAAAAYDRARALDPTTFEWSYLGGLVRLRSGQPAEAAARLREAVERRPDSLAARVHLGEALVASGETAAEEAERHLELYRRHLMEASPLADPALERVLAMKQSGDAVLAEAVRLREAGDVEGSIREHLRALELDPTLAMAHANLMALYGQAQEWAKVDAHFQKAVSLAPGLVEAHYNHALALQQQERTAEAEAALGRVLELSPHHAPAQNALGAIYELAGKLEQAADMYRRAAGNQADFRAARFNLGRVLVDLGRAGEAAREFAQLLAPEDEQSALYLYALAVAEARSGSPQAALGHAQGAIRIAEERGQRELVELASGFERELRLSLAKVPR